MASKVFDYFSFARAKKNREELEKTNPQTPVLKDEDEQFLTKITTHEATAPPLPPTTIADNGEEKEADEKAQTEAAEKAKEVELPTSPPAVEEEHQKTEDKTEATTGDKTEANETADDPPEVAPEEESQGKDEVADKAKEALAPVTDDKPAEAQDATSEKEDQKEGEEKEGSGDAEKEGTSEGTASGDQQSKRTWASYIPSVPVPAIPTFRKSPKGQAADDLASAAHTVKADEGVVLNEDGSIDQEATKEKDEQEVSVLLDRLNLASINNRVFSFSKESQQIYENFTIVLKDIVNGAPTAYDDLEKLLKDSEGQLDKMFGDMPPFVKTLVKSLPAKLTGTLGSNLMAAASEKPGADMKTRMEAASKSESAPAPAFSPAEGSSGSKQKRKVPALKKLVTEQGAVTGMLKSILNFLKVRFPAFMSGTNILMSLAVFILLFVFYYCHKRGKETRLAKAAAEDASATASEVEEEEEEEGEGDDDDEEEEDEAEEGAGKDTELDEKDAEDVDKAISDAIKETPDSSAAAQGVLDQPEPASVPLPEKKEEKELEGNSAEGIAKE